MTSEQNIASKTRHEEMTQLRVSHTLRAHQREWYRGLMQRVQQEGRPYILCTPLSPHEIFEALDLPFVAHAWYSGLVAAKRQSAYYSDVLEAHGYHKGLDRYGSLCYGVVLDQSEREKPWGGLPRAAAVVASAIDRGAEELARYWDTPYFGLEVPSRQTMHPNWWEMSRWQWEDLEGSDRIDLMVAQFNELIAFSEQLAGRKLDLDRLREILARVNEQEACFDEVRDTIARAPKLPARLGEVMSQVMGIQWHRGTPWALAQAQAFRDEVKERAENQLWVCPNERYRFMYVGAGLWQRLDFFAEFERSHGVVFVRSNYLSIASDGYVRHGLRDPVRALASRYSILARQMHIPPLGGAWACWEARRHRVCGALQLDRGRGAKFIARALEAEGIPVLDLPVDPVDGHKWNDVEVRRRVVDFIETRVTGRNADGEVE
jgi:hypothetical protein